jgi:hypothetical protein
VRSATWLWTGLILCGVLPGGLGAQQADAGVGRLPANEHHETPGAEVIEPPRGITLGLRGAVAFPATSSSPDPGFGFDADLERALTSRLAVLVVAGYRSHYDDWGRDRLGIRRMSLNAKFYGRPIPLRAFVNGGAGVYVLDPGSAQFGWNVGGGFGYDLTGRLGLQAAYNFDRSRHGGGHWRETVTFSTVELGLRGRL